MPQTIQTNITSTPKHHDTKRTHPASQTEKPEQKDDIENKHTIHLLRAILKRPSAKKGAYTKHVTFNPKISYKEPDDSNSNAPSDDEEDSQQTYTESNSDEEEDEQHDHNGIAAWIKTIETNTNKIETTLNCTKYTEQEYAEIPCTHTQDDIDRIPDVVDANNVNSNLNDAQLPFLTALYGDIYMKQIRQQSLIDTGASFTFMHSSIFENLPSQNLYINSKKPLKIRTAKGETLQDVATIAIIPMTFKDAYGNFHTLKTLFLVVSVISNEVFLGNDLVMRCKTFININKHTIEYINPNTKTSHIIPITWIKTSPQIKLLADQTFEISPRRSLRILTRPNQTPPRKEMIITNETEDEFGASQNTIHVTNMRVTPAPNIPIAIIITNNSDQFIRMHKNQEIASLIDNDETPIYTSIQEVDAKTLKENQPHCENFVIKANGRLKNNENELSLEENWMDDIPTPVKDYEMGKTREQLDKIEFIKRKMEKEHTMNEQEKQEAIEQFNRNGIYEQSVTRVIEKNSKLTELKKKDKKTLTPQQCVDSLNLDHFNQPTQTKIRKLFLKYEKVLAKSDYDIPRTNGIIADPIVRKEYINKCMLVKHKVINLNLRDEVQEILDNMCDAGVIEQTDEPTPFLSNLLVAKKRNGKLRLLYDCRPSNMAIVNIPSTFTPKTDITYVLGTAGRVSSIDLSNSYFQIGIHPEKRSLFSFCDANGQRYRYCVLAQGFHSSPFYLTTLLNKVLKGLENNVIYYADDIFIYTSKTQTLEDHINIIEEVLKRLQAFELKIKCSKVEIDPPCIEILGITREKSGKFRIPDDKASILGKWPEPKTTEAIKSFICTLNYLNEHIPNFWNLALPLQEQSKQKTSSTQITLTKESKQAFEKLKKAVTHAIAISAPDLDREFFLSSDSSGFASAALLYQVINGVVHYLGAASRLYTKQERKYSTIKLEIMSLLYAFSKWDYILRYSRHTINALTDAKGILYIKNGKDTTNMLYRISQVISHYDMRIMHTSGNPKPANKSLHHNRSTSIWPPDIMSRALRPTPTPTKPISEKELNELLGLLVLQDGYTITPQQLQKFMREPGLPSPSRGLQTKRTSKVKVDTTKIQPKTKPTKKAHPPRFVKTHKYYPNQITHNENNYTDYSKPGTKLPNLSPNITNLENKNTAETHIMTQLNQLDIINTIPTREESRDYTYYRYGKEDIPEHALNTIRLLLDYEERPLHPQSQNNHIESTPPTDEEINIAKQAEELTQDNITEFFINHKLVKDGMIALNVLLEAQRNDPYICKVKQAEPLPRDYSLRNGFLLHNTNGNDKFVIPKALFNVVQNSLHHQIWGRHQPAEKMYQILTKHFYLPKLMDILKSIVSACMICNTTKLQNTKRQTFGKKQLPLANREMWMADIGGGYEDGPKKYFIIFVDALNLYSVAKAIPNKNSQTLRDAFIDNIVNVFGSPKYFYSDNEPALDSDEFKDYCDLNGIQKMHAAPYASHSNGNCEKHIKFAKDIVRSFTKSTGLPYKTILPNITRALNNRILTNTKDLTPAILMFGSDLQPELLSTQTNYTDPGKYAKDLIAKMKRDAEEYRQIRTDNAKRQQEYHNKSRKQITFKEGQHVYYKTVKIPDHGALTDKWTGPYIIKTLHENGLTATIKDYDGISRIAHTHHLKHYETRGQPTLSPTQLDERAIRLLKSKTAKITDIEHRPITRSVTSQETPQENQTRVTPTPDTQEQQSNKQLQPRIIIKRLTNDEIRKWQTEQTRNNARTNICHEYPKLIIKKLSENEIAKWSKQNTEEEIDINTPTNIRQTQTPPLLQPKIVVQRLTRDQIAKWQNSSSQ